MKYIAYKQIKYINERHLIQQFKLNDGQGLDGTDWEIRSMA